jgi:hypothetical protein
MTILDFTCLRAGFTPSQLGLPDSVLEGAGNQPLSIKIELDHNLPPLYRVNFQPRSDHPPLGASRLHSRSMHGMAVGRGAVGGVFR